MWSLCAAGEDTVVEVGNVARVVAARFLFCEEKVT